MENTILRGTVSKGQKRKNFTRKTKAPVNKSDLTHRPSRPVGPQKKSGARIRGGRRKAFSKKGKGKRQKVQNILLSRATFLFTKSGEMCNPFT